MKRTLSLLLASLLLLSGGLTLASCATTGENGTGTDGGLESVAEAAESTPYQALEKQDWEKATFTVLARDECKSDFFTETYGDENNTLLNNLIYERNVIIETDLNIKMEVIGGGDYSGVQESVVKQATTGDDDYDIFQGHKSSFSGLAVNNYLYDMSKIDTIDLDAPWWESIALKNLNVNGVVGLMSGDILPSSLQISACLVFNKRMMKELGKTEPYDSVKEGKWTLDALNEMTADVTRDANGDGKIDIDNDVYGITSWYLNSPFSMYYASGRSFVTVDAEGYPELNYNAEEFVDIYAKLYRGLIEQNSNLCTDFGVYAMHSQMFKEGRALFLDTSLGALYGLSGDMEDDYGLLPEPKYDELQDNYYSFVNGAAPFVGIIRSETAPEFVGAVIEALGAYNYCYVTPNMFEIVTKYRSTRDPQSAEMVDYVIGNRIYDFAYWFDLPIANVVRDQLAAKRAEVSSAVKSADRNSASSLKKILKAYNKKS